MEAPSHRRCRTTASGSRGAFALLALLGALLVLGAPPAAAEDEVICGPGTAAGQCTGTSSVAVDRTAGLLFVAEATNNRISVFDADTGAFIRAFGWGVDTGAAALQVCTAASTCQAGSAGAGAGQMSGTLRIAVDNDPLSEAFGDLYVAEDTNKRVQRFHPDGEWVGAFGSGAGSEGGGPKGAFTDGEFGVEGTFVRIGGIDAGPGGVVHVIDSIRVSEEGAETTICGGQNTKREKRVQRFTAGGAISGTQVVLEAPSCNSVKGFAVGTGGELFAANEGSTGAVTRYSTTGAKLGQFNPSIQVEATASDGAGGIYAAEYSLLEAGIRLPTVNRYSEAGLQQRSFYRATGAAAEPMVALAPYLDGDVFAAERPTSGGEGRVFRIVEPPPGPVELPGFAEATEVKSARATLETRLNPEGAATTFHYEYVDEAGYEAEGFASPEESPEAPLGGPPNFEPKLASQTVEGLAPETAYMFRAVAEDEEGHVTVGETAGPFTTLEPIAPIDFYATAVGDREARLHAVINPLGTPAGGRFQYLTEAEYQANGETFAGASESATLDFGGSEEAEHRSAQLSGLTPDTTYRYRLVASSHCTPDPEFLCEFIFPLGGPLAFTTFPSSAGPPADGCPNAAHRSGLSALLGDCRAYEMVSPPDKGGNGIETRVSANGNYPARLEQSAAAVPVAGPGFSYSSSTAFGDAVAAPWASQYLASRGADGWSSASISPPQEGSANEGARRDRQYEVFSEDLCEGWMKQFYGPALSPQAVPKSTNLYRRGLCGDGAEEAMKTGAEPAPGIAALQGTTPDGACTVFRVSAELEEVTGLPKAFEGNSDQVYERCEGTLRLVSALPDGTANPTNARVGSGGAGISQGRGDVVAGATSVDGERIYWTETGAGAGGLIGTLYLRNNARRAQSPTPGGECSDPANRACTFEVSGLVGAEPARFLAASADGGEAIFSTGEIAKGEATLYRYDAEAQSAEAAIGQLYGVAGQSVDLGRVYLVSGEAHDGGKAGEPNLYLLEGESITFIATLSAEDARVAVAGTTGSELTTPVRLAPFGRSSRVTPDGGALAFTSSAPLTGYDNTDAKSGEADAEVFLYRPAEDELVCVSCLRSGARPVGRNVNTATDPFWVAGRIPGWETQLQASRVLSDDGERLFFESFDALVLRDTNGAQDVYQWQAPGKGDCTEASPGYDPAAEGCVGLISSGEDPADSDFSDASADGSDVFFKTEDSLVGADPGLLDVYDARIGGGFPEPEEPEPGCEGESCQQSVPPPPLPTPGSLSFSPAPRPTAPKRCPKGKHKVKRKGEVRCVKNKKHKAGHKKKARKRHRFHRRAK